MDVIVVQETLNREEKPVKSEEKIDSL